MKRELICINCPMGCPLSVELDAQGTTVLSVSGNHCPRGEKYARTESVSPARTLTTLIVPIGGGSPIAVRTSDPIPKRLLPEAIRIAHTLHIQAGKTHQGDILLRNICGTEADLIQTSP